MYNKPVVVGVSQVKNWSATKTVAQAMADLGQNSGNMMFTEAISNVLNNSTRAPFSITDESLWGRDCIVLASANWINSFEDFGWLADRLERTQLPVFLVGVGAQSTTAMEMPVVKEGTLRLLRLVSERSTSIAARGVFTCEVLEHFGIKNAVPTGCPSLMLAGPTGPQFHEENDPDKVVIHSTRHHYNNTDAFQTYLYRQAFKQRHDLLLQSELADIYYALGRTNNPAILEQASDAVIRAYGTDDIDAIAAYLLEHGKFFTNYKTWIDFMKTRSFCFGTRIHGTIASIIAGTSATLIAHDSRTLELAEAMHVPYVRSSEIDTDVDLEVARYFKPERAAKMLANFQDYYRSYLEFFAANRLEVAPAFRI